MGGLVSLLGFGIYFYIVASQLRSIIALFEPNAAKFQPLALASDWRLFAPAPFTSDRHLLVRSDSAEHSERSPWQLVWAPSAGRWYRMLWNPDRRLSSSVIQSEENLRKTLKSGGAPPSNSIVHLWCKSVALERFEAPEDKKLYQF